LDSADAALAGHETVPERVAANSERRDTPHSGNHNPAWTRQRSKHAL
jgi:hypothetical protein